jgi:hypothetical protein
MRPMDRSWLSGSGAGWATIGDFIVVPRIP